jgi:hypothetical protein
MTDFEEKVRAAFGAEFAGSEPAADLRERAIRKAVGSERGPLRGPEQHPWPIRSRWVQLTALAAAVALVTLGGGIYARHAVNRAETAVQPTPSATVYGPFEAFGKLAAPAIHPPPGGFGGGGGGRLQSTGPPPYYGPAHLSWAGKFPSLPPTAPVYRYPLSDPPADDAFAARLGAVPARGLPEFGPHVRQYSGPGPFDLGIGPSIHLNQPVDTTGLPMFSLVYSPRAPALPPRQPSMSDSQARAIAASFLVTHGLTPNWPSRVSVAPFWSSSLEEPIYAVRYQRLVDLGGGRKAGLVDAVGQPLGLRVDVAAGGTVVEVTGPRPASEQPATYPLEAEQGAVQGALTAPPGESVGPSRVPTVALTQVQLVYTGVTRDGFVYLEPAYLFSGIFREADIPQEKLVLIAAVVSKDIRP